MLILNEFFYPDDKGGTGTAISDIARRLSRTHGAEVTVVTSRLSYREPGARLPKQETWEGIEIVRVPGRQEGRLALLKRLASDFAFTFAALAAALRVKKPDIVLVTSAPAVLPIAGTWLKRLRNVPYVYLVYDLDPDRSVVLGLQSSGSLPVKLLGRAQTRWLAGAKTVVAIGRCMRDYLIERYGQSADRIRVVEVGADPTTVVPRTKETQFRAEHGIDGFLVLYSGNFGRYHDFDTLLAAAEQLPDVEFVLVGDGAKKPYVSEQVELRRLANVRLFPFVPLADFPDLLASADLTVVTLEPGMEGLCVPSKFYSFLAAGRPVLALMGTSSEVVQTIVEYDLGFHVEVGDVDRMVSVIRNAASDPARLERQGARAREVFDRLYSADRTAEKMHAILAANRRAR